MVLLFDRPSLVVLCRRNRLSWGRRWLLVWCSQPRLGRKGYQFQHLRFLINSPSFSQIRMWPMEGAGRNDSQKNSIKQRNGGRHNCWWQGMLRRLPLGYLYTKIRFWETTSWNFWVSACSGAWIFQRLNLRLANRFKTSSTRPIFNQETARSGPFWARNGRSQSSCMSMWRSTGERPQHWSVQPKIDYL